MSRNPQKGQKKPSPRPRGDATPYKTHLKPVVIEQFKKYGTILAAAEATNLDRKTIMQWRKNDPEFNNSFLEYEVNLVENVGRRMYQLALKGSEHETNCPNDEKRKGKYVCMYHRKAKIKISCPVGADTGLIKFIMNCRDKRYRIKTQEYNFNIISQGVDIIVEVIQATLPDDCPHCHRGLSLRKNLFQAIEDKRIELEGDDGHEG